MTIISSLTPEEAIGRMWQICDKPERFKALDVIDRELSLTEDYFWTTFWEVWSAHESVYLDHSIIEEMIARHDLGMSAHFLDEDEKRVLAKLPCIVEIYRGGQDHNVLGWSWTLDYDKAVWFANRSAGGSNPVVAHATVPREKILAYLSGRNEQEIVARPTDVLINYREHLPELDDRRVRHNTLYAEIQSRAFESHLEDHAILMAANAVISGRSLAEFIESMNEDLVLAEAFGSTKAEYLRLVLRFLIDHQNGGSVLEPILQTMRR